MDAGRTRLSQLDLPQHHLGISCGSGSALQQHLIVQQKSGPNIVIDCSE